AGRDGAGTRATCPARRRRQRARRRARSARGRARRGPARRGARETGRSRRTSCVGCSLFPFVPAAARGDAENRRKGAAAPRARSQGPNDEESSSARFGSKKAGVPAFHLMTPILRTGAFASTALVLVPAPLFQMTTTVAASASWFGDATCPRAAILIPY